MTKSITIKNALITDKEYLDKLAISTGMSVSTALSAIVNIAKTYEQTAETLQKTTEETGKLNLEITELKAQLQKSLEDKEEFRKTIVDMLDHPIEKTVEKTVEKTIEVEKKLTGSQFICELDEKTAYNARLVRKFAVKDGFVTFEKDIDYPEELAKVAIKQFINRHYIDLID